MTPLADPLELSPSREDEPAFAAPWEATAFALRAHLVATGRLDAGLFAQRLGEELGAGHAAADDGTAYFVAFVRALERSVEGLVGEAALSRERDAWRTAAAATPHGAPILLGERGGADG